MFIHPSKQVKRGPKLVPVGFMKEGKQHQAEVCARRGPGCPWRPRACSLSARLTWLVTR